MRLANKWLTCQCTFIYAQCYRVDQHPIGWDFIASAKHNDVAHNNIFARHLSDNTIAYHFNCHIVIYLIEYLKFLVCIYFKRKTYAGGKHDCHKNTSRFKKHLRTMIGGNKLIYSNTH